MESAYLPVFSKLPGTTSATELEAARKGQMIYASVGITTAQEGATHAPISSLTRTCSIAGRSRPVSSAR